MKTLSNFCVVALMAVTLGLVAPAGLIAAHDGAYDDGYQQGLVEGYDRGYSDASRGRRHHYHAPDGYNAFTRGLHDGRHAGYSAGYDDARNDRPHRYRDRR